MRLWKLTDAKGLESLEVAGAVPDWMVNRDDLPANQLTQRMRDHPNETLARYEVPLEGGRKTFLFATATPGDGIMRQIQQREREGRY